MKQRVVVISFFYEFDKIVAVTGSVAVEQNGKRSERRFDFDLDAVGIGRVVVCCHSFFSVCCVSAVSCFACVLRRIGRSACGHAEKQRGGSQIIFNHCVSIELVDCFRLSN